MSISNHKKYLEYIYTLEDSKKWCFSQRFFHRKILYSNNRITSKLKHSKLTLHINVKTGVLTT